MKKTFKTFALMLLTAFAFSSCVDVPAPYNLPDKSSSGGSSEEEGISATCQEALAVINGLSNGGATSQTYVVTGYITDVFAISGKPCFWMADTPDGGKVIEAFAATLPEGVAAFEIGMKVKAIGKLKKYVKNDSVTPEVENPTVVILENGGGGTSGETTLIDFTKGQGSWTPNNVSGPEVWTNSSQYGQVASGFDNDNKVSQAAEGWLISPEIDLTNSTNTQIVLNEAVNKLGTGSTVDSQCQVLACLSGDASGASNWQVLTADKRPAGTSWTFQDDTFNASAFDGKKILLAFKYTSTESSAPSWEIKTVKLKNGSQGGGDNGGGSNTSSSSKNNPLTITQAKNATGNNYVKGYIVGYIDGMSLASGATFGVPSAAETEILLAESPNETSSDNVFPVQLPTGNIRNALELSAHPDYLKQEVLLYGSVEKYFGVTGMKATSWAQINGQSFGVDPDGDSGGNTSSDDANEIIDFTKGQGSWSPSNVSGPDVWTNSSQYGEVASGFDNDNKVCQAAEGWLISPEIDLTNSTNSQIVLNEAINKIGTGSTVDAQCQVLACVNNGQISFNSDWQPLVADKRPAGTSWTFQDDTFDASAFDGKKILIAFKYISTESSAPSWEIKTVKVIGGGSSQGGDGGGQGGDGGDTPGPGGDDVTELVNGNFEEWVSDTEPLGWKSASTASNAKLSQSQDARGGSYSCRITAATTVDPNRPANHRLATQEITLEAGTYTFSFYAKATTGDVCQTRPGYVPINADGSVGTYTYKDLQGNQIYVDINNNEWTLASIDFTLTQTTKLCLIVMNPKTTQGKSISQDILVDDATLVKK